MEFDITRRTIILDFYGMPGGGKSTVSHYLALDLRKRGFSVQEPSYLLDHRYSKAIRAVLKLGKTLAYAISHPYNLKRIIELIKECKVENSRAFLSHFVNITNKLLFCEKKADYLLLDEGLIQASISLTQTSDYSCQKCLNTIEKMLARKGEIVPVYIKLKPEVALLRLLNRQSHDSRVERLESEQEMLTMLKAIKRRCDTVNHGRIICLDGELDLKQEVFILRKHLQQDG